MLPTHRAVVKIRAIYSPRNVCCFEIQGFNIFHAPTYTDYLGDPIFPDHGNEFYTLIQLGLIFHLFFKNLDYQL